MSRATGTVKWFSNEKGYGFIQREGHEDVFVHHSQITMEGFRTLDAGETVEFEIVAGDRGPKATNVRRPGATEGASSAGEPGGPTGGAESPPPTRGAGGNGDDAAPTLLEQIRRKLGGRFFD